MDKTTRKSKKSEVSSLEKRITNEIQKGACKTQTQEEFINFIVTKCKKYKIEPYDIQKMKEKQNIGLKDFFLFAKDTKNIKDNFYCRAIWKDGEDAEKECEKILMICKGTDDLTKCWEEYELDPKSKHLVISTMEDQAEKQMTGGTMRLGNYDCVIDKGTLAYKVYGKTKITERHRHRGECNNEFRDEYEKWGIKASGINKQNNLVEIIEGINHPFMLASQFHPEFKSRPNRPHPMFDGFIKALIK